MALINHDTVVSGSLSEALTRLFAVRFDDRAPAAVFDLIVSLTLQASPAAGAAVLALSPDEPAPTALTAVAGTLEEARTWDEGDGPCAEVMATGLQVHAGGDFSRWPMFAERAARCGVRDAIVSPVAVRPDRQAYLSVYALERRLEQTDVIVIDVIAQHAAAVMANALGFEHLQRRTDQLQEGLRSREMIGLAKGILMHQERCSEVEAFRILVRSSQRLNKKVRDVAEHVVALAEGRVDGAPTNG